MHKLKSNRQQLCSLQHCTTQTNPQITVEKFGHSISSSSRVDKRLQVVINNVVQKWGLFIINGFNAFIKSTAPSLYCQLLVEIGHSTKS